MLRTSESESRPSIALLFLLAAILPAVEFSAIGQEWVLRKPTTSPSARYGHAMAYDAARQRVILFGGGGPGPTGAFNDTWAWDGKNWTQLYPKTSPSARVQAMVVYDSHRKRIVLHGGRSGLIGYNDTWEWDGTTWVQLFPAKRPALTGAYEDMAYDAAMRKIVMFGTSGTSYPHSTWTYDGKTWALVLPKTKPGGRTSHAMTYDAARQRVVLFGGLLGAQLDDTWEWNGFDWTQRITATKPDACLSHSLVYDVVRKRSVLFGGYDGSKVLKNTWEWDGRTWTKQIAATSPPARSHHGAAYDLARRRVVVFGGLGTSVPYLNDTWEYAGPNLVAGGTPRPGGRVAFNVEAPGNAGRFYQLGSSLGLGPIPIDSRFLDLGPDHLLVASTSGNLPWIFSGYRGVIDSGGKASAALNIPSIPALIGTRVYSAFVTLEPKAPSGIWAISNTETVVISK